MLLKVKEYIYDKIPKKDLHGFEYTIRELVGMYENSKKMADSWHGKVLNDDILQYKTSDTIFILGSGPSINDISDKEWKKINMHNSIGFNWWFVHTFVPSFYLFQAASEGMLNILHDKYSEYRSVPFLLRGSHFAQGKIDFTDKRIHLLKNNDVFYVREYPIHSSCSIDIELLFKYVEALGIFSFNQISSFVPKWRCTLGLLISLSYQLGYKNIVLCGMDMHGADHFWDNEKYNAIKEKYDLPEKGKSNLKTFTDNSYSKNTVPEYVYKLREWMYKKNKVNLYILKEGTVLHPKIPLYKI